VAEVEVWAVGLSETHARIVPRFARSEPRERVLAYVRGLLAPLEKKNSWTLAERAQPGEPHQPDREPETRSVRHRSTPAPVPDRHDPAGRAPTHIGVGLDGQDEPCRSTLHGQHVHPGHVEQGVGARTSGHARSARRDEPCRGFHPVG